MFLKIVLLINLLLFTVPVGKCNNLKARLNLKFYLWRSNQRSLKERLFVNNVESFEACKDLAKKFRGLALNYSPKERFGKQRSDHTSSRDHYWQQPHLYFNCHILQCPETDAFKTMANDSSFDYYSFYENPMPSTDYICVPEVGIFMLHTVPDTYQNAALKCHHSHKYCGTLAHVASPKRTDALARLIVNYNEQNSFQNIPRVYLAYIGLQYNSSLSPSYEFFNDENESLKFFAYRAWEPGSPKISSDFSNTSCVALTVNRSWKTVKCDRKLPFICEILTTCVDLKF